MTVITILDTIQKCTLNHNGRLVTRELNLNELNYYEEVEPRHIDHRDNQQRYRRQISFSNSNRHTDEKTVLFSGFNREFFLHMFKNDMLIPDSFLNIFQHENGSYVSKTDFEHCYYQGFLNNMSKATVSMSTCRGLKGVIVDVDNEEYIIHPHFKNTSRIIIYQTKDAKTSRKPTCGMNYPRYRRKYKEYNKRGRHGKIKTKAKGFVEFGDPNVQNAPLRNYHRVRRSSEFQKYIEVLLVMDNSEYRRSHDIKSTQERGLEIMNTVDSYYKNLNTRIVVTNLIVWNVADRINVTNDAGETLDAFEDFTRLVLNGEMKLEFDNAQLLTGANWGTIAGLASVDNVCTLSSSAVTQDHGKAYETANTMAHEIGHNIGFSHYTCSCADTPCVMSDSVPHNPCRGFASCTQEYYEDRLNSGDLDCLFNYPRGFFQGAICGNALLEENEDCDCGSELECIESGLDQCCDFSVCKFRESVECSTGECCENCRFKSSEVACREKLNECDLEEYCSGNSSTCPIDYHVQDGVTCNNDSAFCYSGECQTHTLACEFLWGDAAKQGENICYKINLKKADVWTNCGRNDYGKYLKCDKSDQLCGTLHCQQKSNEVYLPKFPVVGTRRGKKTIVYWYKSKTVKCITGRTWVPTMFENPTLTPDGTKCAENSICIEQKCTNISSLGYLKKCEKPCLNGGVCNNNGHCHCKKGYACPYCEYKGSGGSIDSGKNCVYESNILDNCSTITCKVFRFFDKYINQILVNINIK